ncbi:MAG: hypothetical protein SVR81_08930 [Chloroflexota bacterium]|nr:hypothetical protein [Chloroflexota bacterium]
MDVKTKPQHWFQMEPKSTEELTRIWEQRDIITAPEADLALVEQVLIARHILAPSETELDGSRELVDAFEVQELGVSRRSAAWEVRLKSDLAEFIGPRGQGRFVIGRELARLEFQFRSAGLLMLGESSVARVRGKIFDFGEHKAQLEDWLLPPTPEMMRREVRLMGAGLLILGVLAFYPPTVAGPILGGLLILLGLFGLVAPRRGAFFANGLLLVTTGAATLLGLVLEAQTLIALGPVLTIFWAALSLFEFVWGYRSFANFRKFRMG